MMIAEHALTTMGHRSRRAPATPASAGVGGFVFAVAALPGEAEGFRWPSWLSPIARSLSPRIPHHSSSKRNR